MKKVVFTILALVAFNIGATSTLRAEENQIESVKQEVILTLVKVFNGELSTSDSKLTELKAQADALPAGDKLSDEIRSALEAVMAKSQDA